MLQSLDRRRSQAFSSLNAADLDAIYVPGSPPWSSDRSLLASYRKQQVRVEGLRMQIETLIVEHPGDETVVLRIVDRLIMRRGCDPLRSANTAPSWFTNHPPSNPHCHQHQLANLSNHHHLTQNPRQRRDGPDGQAVASTEVELEG